MATIAEMNQAYTTRLQELEAEVKSLKKECDDLTEREAEARNEAEFLRGENDRIKDELDDYIQLTIDCCESGNPDHDDLLGYINGLQQKEKELTEKNKGLVHHFNMILELIQTAKDEKQIKMLKELAQQRLDMPTEP